MKKETIGIITVLYNSQAVLDDFFESLNRQVCRDFTLYVVDNASPDGSLEYAEMLAEKASFETVFIRNSQNGGIAQGNNIGIRAAKAAGCEWILLTNNDTVWNPELLMILLEQAYQNKAEIVVPKIRIHGTDRIWYAGGGWDRWRGGTTHVNYGKPDHSCGSGTARPVAYAPTCCMLIHNSVFDRVGYMDESFFIYYDDSDFVYRAAEMGIPVWLVPQAVIYHKESVSIGAVSALAQYWLSRNLLWFTYKHYSKAYWIYVLCVNLLILFTKRLFTFGRDEWQASWKGYRDGMHICHENQVEPTLEKIWRG